MGLLNDFGDGGSLGGIDSPVWSLLTDIVEKVESTVVTGYVCAGVTSETKIQILHSNRDIFFQK